MTQDQNKLKAMAGQRAAQYAENGMILGLGTGSTVSYLINALGKRLQEENLQITGVTTSLKTAKQAKSLNIPIKDINEVDHIDLAIDGADEVDSNFNGIKGGGGALLWEKIVNNAANRNIWIVDQSKIVSRIGAFGVPVEVVPFGAEFVFRDLKKLGYQPQWRLDNLKHRFLTDEKNYIIDLKFGLISDPEKLANELIKIVGVVEHGLFLNRVDEVIIGQPEGIKTINIQR